MPSILLAILRSSALTPVMRTVQPTYSTKVDSTTATTCHEKARHSRKHTSASSTIVGTNVKTTALNTIVIDLVPRSIIRCSAPVRRSRWNDKSRFRTWLNTCSATLRPAACATGVNATDRSSVAKPEIALKVPLATSAHAAARRAIATAASFPTPLAIAASVNLSTATLNRMGTARPVDFCTSMADTANASLIAVPLCATDTL